MARGRRRAILLLVAGLAIAALGACGGGSKKLSPKPRTTPRAVGTSTGATVATTVPNTTTTSTTADGTPTAAFVRPFALNSPWNTPVETLPTDPNSDQMMLYARERIGAVEATDEPSSVRGRILNDPLFININRWTVPVVDETNGVPTPMYCRQPPLPPKLDLCGDGWTVKSLLVPAGENPHPQYDGWFTILNRKAGLAYDLWRARRSLDGGSMSYQFMRIWDIGANGPGFQQPDIVSARGSGLPLFAGLIQPEEIQAGRIDHALAISVPAPAQRTYVQPASSTDGIGRLASLPEGARIRLKPGITLKSIQRRFINIKCRNPLYGLVKNQRSRLCRRYRFPAGTDKQGARAILTALRKYGAIVVDRARVPTLYAKFNFDWSTSLRDVNGDALDANGKPLAKGAKKTPLLSGNELQGIRLADFEVVQLGPKLTFPAPGQITVTPLPGGAIGQKPTGAPSSRRRTPQRQTFQPGGGG